MLFIISVQEYLQARIPVGARRAPKNRDVIVIVAAENIRGVRAVEL